MSVAILGRPCRIFSLLVLTLLLLYTPRSVAGDDFLLQADERVVFLGNTLVEREQSYGDWELQLTLAAQDRRIQFRNLGWSGDTVWAESRGMFDPPAVGYQRMFELIRELKPTTVILGYGTVEAFQGKGAIPKFSAQYQKLRNDLKQEGARLIHLSPVLMEPATFPVQGEQATEHVSRVNAQLAEYAEVIRSIANTNGELFVDFQTAQRNLSDGTVWTENGIHLSAEGYAATAEVLVQALGGAVHSGDHSEVRSLIQRKNELFFHRWRPQNFTYLLGFRKHEQGQNAVEIAQFDPLIGEVESKIRELIAK